MAIRFQQLLHLEHKPSSDFWKFWLGQTISNLGSSFTIFALPLLVFNITHSAFDLAIVSATAFLPYLLFGLIIGAWVDRVNRRRLMIYADLARAALMASIPLLASQHLLAIWWFYIVSFIYSILTISFDAAQFAAIPSLVHQDDLVTANGRIQASYSAANVIGPLLAGLLLAVIAVPLLLLVDTTSFLVSALSLALIRTSFNAEKGQEQKVEAKQKKPTIWQDIAEGLRYVLSHPVLRAISIMIALVNLVSFTINAQLILFAKLQFQVADTQIGLFYAAEGVCTIILSLAAGPLRKRWPFNIMILGSLMLYGLLIFLFSLQRVLWAAVPLWGLIWAMGMFFNINTASLRQTIVPNQMLGRVMTVATVLGMSAIPLGTLIGGILIQRLQNVVLIYAGIGILVFLIAASFSFSALGHARRHLAQEQIVSVEQGGQ